MTIYCLKRSLALLSFLCRRKWDSWRKNTTFLSLCFAWPARDKNFFASFIFRTQNMLSRDESKFIKTIWSKSSLLTLSFINNTSRQDSWNIGSTKFISSVSRKARGLLARARNSLLADKDIGYFGETIRKVVGISTANDEKVWIRSWIKVSRVLEEIFVSLLWHFSLTASPVKKNIPVETGTDLNVI